MKGKQLLAATMVMALVGSAATVGSSAKTTKQELAKLKLTSQTVYNIDLDGDGKTEKIQYFKDDHSEADKNPYAMVSVRINDKEVIQKKVEEFMATPEVSICDMDETDNKKEIELNFFGMDDAQLYLNYYHYVNTDGTAKGLLDYENDFKVYNQNIVRVLGIYQNKAAGKNGEIIVNAEPDRAKLFYNFGCYGVELNLKLDGDKINVNRQKTYSLVQLYDSKKDKKMCRLAADTKGYKDNNCKKLKVTLKKNVKVVPVKIKYYGKNNARIQVKVKTGQYKGKKVWLKTKKETTGKKVKELFKSAPGWC